MFGFSPTLPLANLWNIEDLLPSYPDTVSYTHLDVYKRQLSTLREEKEPELAALPVAFSGMAGAFYHKVPNPLAEIVQRLPIVDGLDADKLLNIFKIWICMYV